MPQDSPLDGLRVLDLSRALPGAMATQFLADGGADVLLVEPPEGSPLRAYAGWPSLGRGKRSAVLDLGTDEGRAALQALLADADVLLTTGRPRPEVVPGLSAEALQALNPRLISASITGFGSSGPYAGIKGYEGVVMAKLGYFHAKHMMAPRSGPAFISVPFASWGAAQGAVQGILAALVERESSGLGQRVESDLARGVHAIDTWAWFTEMVGVRWPDAYQVVDAFNQDFEPLAPLLYPLLVAPTKDGHWIQFACVEPRLFMAMMEEFGLMGLFADPRWAGIPVLPTQELRTELWEIMIGKVGERALAEWESVFASNPNIFAEPFRPGARALEHPQVVHDNRAVTLEDPEVGPVHQPATLALADGRHTTALRPAPLLGADTAAFSGTRSAPTTHQAPSMPLSGLTVLDFGLMFAGPFGATLLTDLGARVIKVETLAGDTIRRIQPFPESAGAKVMQGKESICVDLTTEEGLAIVHALVARADVVVQAFRAGAAQRAKIDAETLQALNPDLVYVNAPGYGTDGPYGGKPAYAPSIAAATGLGLIEAPGALHATGSISDMKRASAQLNQATAVPAIQADGISALGVASTILMAVLARARGHRYGELTATMLGTTLLALQNDLVEYDGKPAGPRVDDGFHGWHALYRLYPTAQGWVFLAVVTDAEWRSFTKTMAADRLDDPRFTTAASRREHDEELIALLSSLFAGKPAAEWERLLLDADVACVEAVELSPQKLLQTEPSLIAEYTTTATSPVYDEHLRLQPMVRFSRSETQAKGFHAQGEDTDAVLAELGYDAERIADLRARSIIA